MSLSVKKALFRRHFGSLTEEVTASDTWNDVLGSGFALLEAIGKPFGTNTHLASLALNVICSREIRPFFYLPVRARHSRVKGDSVE